MIPSLGKKLNKITMQYNIMEEKNIAVKQISVNEG
jgi:hypothetical protein